MKLNCDEPPPFFAFKFNLGCYHLVKSSKRDPGLREVVVSFAGVTAGF